ncbi:metallophosphoesterase [Pedobacter aquatilis]|uniref:metallophosphoesterase n=1 Tax=Pedobacter aquatilis TaxID=351343 RepID=UPI00292E0756|nr:metallophosphoesterase [Pedobacter aquatilis]
MSLSSKFFFSVTYLNCCLGLSSLFAQVNQDGPYIQRKEQNIEVVQVTNNQAIIKTLKESDPIEVSFYHKPELNFKFKLHPIQVQPTEFKVPDKIFALSDIEGEFEDFRNLLINNKIIDKDYNWTFGNGHMVICGDLFDRGEDVLPSIWLLYKLEEEAKKQGGYLHVILGNHDIMNMSGDLRYLSPKYIASAKLIGTDYLSQLSEKTELGAWLRSKNAIEKIGDRLFLHAGISPALAKKGKSLDEINSTCRKAYGKSRESLSEEENFLIGSMGPFWYRGYFMQPQTEETAIDDILKTFNAKQILVGHTILESNIGFYYNKKVVGLDVNHHRGVLSGMFIKDNKCIVFDKDGTSKELN